MRHADARSMDLPGRVAVVTGASEGIGAALAAKLAKAGCRVALVARNEARLAERVAALTARGFDARAFACDLSDRAGLEQCFKDILADLGRVDLLFNNAGVGRFGSFVDHSLEEIVQPLDVPATAAALAARLVLPSMLARGHGQIVNIIGPAAYFDLPHMVPYTVSRTAELTFTRALDAELDGTGVRVRAVCPAWVDTEYIERNATDADWLPAISRWFPRHSPEEVATRIVAGLETRERELLLSKRLRMFAWSYRHFPRLSVMLLKRAGLYQPARERANGGSNAVPVKPPSRNQPGAAEWTNWEESIDLEATEIVFPESIDDVVSVLTDRERYPSPVRPAGSRHTTTHCGVTDGGTLLVMRRMQRIVHIDTRAMTVTCEAGALYIDVAKALEREGLQFYVNVEIGNLTMGSAATTGTKDASMAGELGQVCSYCIGVRMVLPSGEVVSIDDDEANAELMQAVRSSYGLLGVVVEVTFKVRPVRPMAIWHRTYTLDEFERALPDIRRGDASVMYYMFPFLGTLTVEFRRYRSDTRFRPNRWLWKLRNASWKTIAPAFSRFVTRYVPGRWLRNALLDSFYRVLQLVMTTMLKSGSTVATDQQIRYPEHRNFSAYTFSIWAFREEGIMPAMREFYAFSRDYEREHGFRCDILNVGYRIAEDDKPLFSYSYDGTVMTLDPVTTGSPGWDEFLEAYNAFCSARDGVPLFNQSKWLTREQVQKAFGQRIDIFWRLRSEYDPDDRLLNAYFRELFAPGAG